MSDTPRTDVPETHDWLPLCNRCREIKGCGLALEEANERIEDLTEELADVRSQIADREAEIERLRKELLSCPRS